MKHKQSACKHNNFFLTKNLKYIPVYNMGQDSHFHDSTFLVENCNVDQLSTSSQKLKRDSIYVKLMQNLLWKNNTLKANISLQWWKVKNPTFDMCARNSLNSAAFWSFIYQNVIKNNTVHDRLENYYLHLRTLKNKKRNYYII